MKIALSLIPGLLLLGSVGLMAQPTEEEVAAVKARVLAALDKHVGIVVGADSPQTIPYGTRLRAVFMKLENELRSPRARDATLNRIAVNLSDQIVLAGLESRNAEFYESHGSKGAADIAATCQAVLSGSQQNAYDIGSRFDALARAETDRLEKHFIGIMEELSTVASQRIAQEADEIAARTTYSTFDHIGLASDEPSMYLATMEKNCKRIMSQLESADTAPKVR